MSVKSFIFTQLGSGVDLGMRYARHRPSVSPVPRELM